MIRNEFIVSILETNNVITPITREELNLLAYVESFGQYELIENLFPYSKLGHIDYVRFVKSLFNNLGQLILPFKDINAILNIINIDIINLLNSQLIDIIDTDELLDLTIESTITQRSRGNGKTYHVFKLPNEYMLCGTTVFMDDISAYNTIGSQKIYAHKPYLFYRKKEFSLVYMDVTHGIRIPSGLTKYTNSDALYEIPDNMVENIMKLVNTQSSLLKNIAVSFNEIEYNDSYDYDY